jgi:hypothetical protein
MNRIVTTSLIATAAAAALAVGACAPAFADGTSTPTPSAGRSLATIQANAKIKTTARIGALNTAISKVTAAKDVSSGDRATILATLNGDIAGMNSIEAKIAAERTAATAAADYATIFTGYRVYAVAIPQARLAAAADRMTGTTIPKLDDAHTKLVAALAGPDASKSTAALQADLADMSAQTAAASELLDGIAARSLAVTASAYNSNHAVMQPIRTAITTAIADLKKAAADGKTVLAAIK